LVSRFVLHRKVAFITCCILLVSYGFWRYSVEAEVYALNNLLLVLIVGLLYPLAEKYTKVYMLRLIVAAVLAGFATLLYKPNIIIVGVAFGLPMLMKGYWRQLVYYAAIIMFIVLMGYYFAFRINAGGYQSYISFLLGGSSQSYGSILMSGVVVVGNIVGLNFIYAFPDVANLIASSFPANMIVEEVFAAQNKWTVAAISCLTLLITGSLLGWILFKTFRYLHFRAVLHNPFAVWILAYSLMLLVLDPNSPEGWLMISLPLVVLFGTSILSIYCAFYQYKIVWLFIAFLLLHNIIGGHLFIRSVRTDYTAFHASWLLKNGTNKDVVLSLGSATMLRYILYYSPVQICEPEYRYTSYLHIVDSTLAAGGSVYLLDDMVHPSPTIAFRNRKAYDAAVSFVQANRAGIVSVNQGTKNEAIVYKLVRFVR
jgi:hypothetical protein